MPEQPAVGFCTECGTGLTQGERFCGGCGSATTPQASSSAPQPSAPAHQPAFVAPQPAAVAPEQSNNKYYFLGLLGLLGGLIGFFILKDRDRRTANRVLILGAAVAVAVSVLVLAANLLFLGWLGWGVKEATTSAIASAEAESGGSGYYDSTPSTGGQGDNESKAAVQSDLRNAATAQETVFTESGSYTSSISDLQGAGFRYSDGDNYAGGTPQITISRASATSYCMYATDSAGDSHRVDTSSGLSEGTC